MNIINIPENESITLSDGAVKTISNMINDNPLLPIDLMGNVLSFKDYTVGSILLGDTTYNIIPRNPVFTLNTIFEMIMYTNNIQISDMVIGYDFSNMSGIQIVPLYFISLCKKLIGFGLTGSFNTRIKNSKRISGNIVYDEYNKHSIPYKGLVVEEKRYEADIPANQIIKSALLKLLSIKNTHNYEEDLFVLLDSFEEISEYNSNPNYFKESNYGFYSANPYYDEIIQLSINILTELKMSFLDGSLEWFSFLFNSNELFEQYARKLVSNVLDLHVEKWSLPKPFASLEYLGSKQEKSYVPDIIIEYNLNENSALAIIDVKNKNYAPSKNNLTNSVSSADLYQIMFYCRKLKCSIGALLYPSNKDYDPVRISISDDNDLKIYLISINMNVPYKLRKKNLSTWLNENLISYS